MSRIDRRIARKSAPVSLKLLQAAHEQLQQEAGQMRNVLFSLAKEHGRLRFSKRTLDSLSESDGIEAELSGEHYVITYKQHDGAQVAPKESA